MSVPSPTKMQQHQGVSYPQTMMATQNHHHHHHHHHHHQYYAPRPVLPSVGPWSTGLFDCCNDMETCCLAVWCPCVAFGRVAEIVDEGVVSCRLSGCLCTLLVLVFGASSCYTSWIRNKMRQRYLLEAGPCGNECLLHLCCFSCAVSQEYRELVNRGYDMSLGWKGNVERHTQMAPHPMMQPAVQWGMMRNPMLPL